MYTVCHYINRSMEFAGKQGRHQIFDASILPYKFGLIFIRMKQKKSKRPIFQNGRFSKSPILKIFSGKFHRLVLGLVGLIDAKGIDVAQPRYMVVRLSDIRAKTGKK